ncbi:hypothetical protein GCM10022245_46650 [Streptomyces mayteni]
MRTKPIDERRMGLAVCVGDPEPRTTPEGVQRRDRDGRPQWQVQVAVRNSEERRAEVLEIVLPVEPAGLAVGVPVRLVDLWATDWEMEGRTGTSWRAASVVPVAPPAEAPAAAASGRGGKSAGGDR